MKSSNDKMKAAVLERIGEIVVKEVDIPVCPEDSILIKVEACAICGSDLRIFKKVDKRVKFPQIIGHEIAGRIVKIGRMVKGFKIGDRVISLPGPSCGKCIYCKEGFDTQCLNMIHIGYNWPGGFAQYHIPPSRSLKKGRCFINKIPDNLPFEEACIAELLGCCINAQEFSNVRKNDSVAIIGGGPAGCMHIELAKLRGANKVFLVQRSQTRLKMAKNKFNADVFISSQSEDFVERILKETNGYGVDVVIVACSSKEAQEKSLKIIKGKGRINFFGGLSADDSIINIDSNIVHYKECIIQGSQSSTGIHNRKALKLFSDRKINAKDFITHIFPLSRIKEAIKIAETGMGLKIVVKPWL
ncbi:MAG: alcohol dehydrogenase catalytic domain-containing protein [Candidatus Firestonebacteria bacterium]